MQEEKSLLKKRNRRKSSFEIKQPSVSAYSSRPIKHKVIQDIDYQTPKKYHIQKKIFSFQE